MVQRIPAHLIGKPFSQWELTIKETFSMLELYKRIHKFLSDNRWNDLTGGTVDGGGDNYEDYFFQRSSNGMQFHQIWWRATKRPRISGNNYFQYYMALDIATVAMKDVEVMHNGQKVKLQNGEIRFRAFFYLSEEDPNAGSSGQEWKNNSLLSLARSLGFWKRDNPEVLRQCETELMKQSNDLYTLLQQFTGVRREGPTKDFYPVKGASN